MTLASSVKDVKGKWFASQTDGRQTNKVKPASLRSACMCVALREDNTVVFNFKQFFTRWTLWHHMSSKHWPIHRPDVLYQLLYNCICQDYPSGSASHTGADASGLPGSGAHFTNVFSIAFQIRWKLCFTLTSILKQWSLQILYMARQLCCRGMCKNLLRSDGQQRRHGKAKFPSNLIYGQKTVSHGLSNMPCGPMVFTRWQFSSLYSLPLCIYKYSVQQPNLLQINLLITLPGLEVLSSAFCVQSGPRKPKYLSKSFRRIEAKIRGYWLPLNIM